MKIILLKEVKNLGKEGDVVEVKEGYARNYLVPNKLAIEATPGNLSQVESLRKKRALREMRELEATQFLQSKIQGMVLEFVKKAGATGKLYGSLTTKEIAEAISRNLGSEFDKKYIELPEPIKEIGKHEVKINFGRDIYGTVTVQILPEEAPEREEVKGS